MIRCISLIGSFLLFVSSVDIVRGQEDEMEWRDEALSVAREALGKKYPSLVNSDSILELYRYSNPSVLQRQANEFSFIVSPKDDTSNTHRCDVNVSRYRGQAYSFVFGEPACFKVTCSREKVAGLKLQRVCRKQ